MPFHPSGGRARPKCPPSCVVPQEDINRANGMMIREFHKSRDHYSNTQGVQHGFENMNSDLQGVSNPLERDRRLRDYMDQWYPFALDHSDFQEGWYPRWNPKRTKDREDKTHIKFISSGAWIKVHGKTEDVIAMVPMAVAFAQGIPVHVARATPFAAFFWDRMKELGCYPHPEMPDRPSTAVLDEDEKFKLTFFDDGMAITSDAVKNYELVPWNEECRAICAEALDFLVEEEMEYDPSFDPVRGGPGALEEAERKLRAVMNDLLEAGGGEGAYASIQLKNGDVILPGQLMAYCDNFWINGEKDLLGIRWRPLDSKTNERGGITVDAEGLGVKIQGNTALVRACLPILAGVYLKMDPRILVQCPSSSIFFAFVNHDPHLGQVRHVSTQSRRSKRQMWDVGSPCFDDDSVVFASENNILMLMQGFCQKEYVRTLGMYSGGEPLKGEVRWSRKDFRAHVLMWWPDSSMEVCGRFRMRPCFMSTGGLTLNFGGENMNLQAQMEWAAGMICILAALFAGIPAEIASLLPESDPFWELIEDIFGLEEVQKHRLRIRRVRDEKFGSDWRGKRLEALKAEAKHEKFASSERGLPCPENSEAWELLSLRCTESKKGQTRASVAKGEESLGSFSSWLVASDEKKGGKEGGTGSMEAEVGSKMNGHLYTPSSPPSSWKRWEEVNPAKEKQEQPEEGSRGPITSSELRQARTEGPAMLYFALLSKYEVGRQKVSVEVDSMAEMEIQARLYRLFPNWVCRKEGQAEAFRLASDLSQFKISIWDLGASQRISLELFKFQDRGMSLLEGNGLVSAFTALLAEEKDFASIGTEFWGEPFWDLIEAWFGSNDVIEQRKVLRDAMENDFAASDRVHRSCQETVDQSPLISESGFESIRENESEAVGGSAESYVTAEDYKSLGSFPTFPPYPSTRLFTPLSFKGPATPCSSRINFDLNSSSPSNMGEKGATPRNAVSSSSRVSLKEKYERTAVGRKQKLSGDPPAPPPNSEVDL